MISASAVGYYGDRGDELLDEESPAGTGFMAEICVAWERAALRAEALGVRVLRMRQGVVLGLGGGFLERLLPLARRGLGAPLGSGQQFLPWIHIDDLVDVISRALVDPRLAGAIDLVAPQPVRMGEMMQALGRATGHGTLPAVPKILLRAALGQSADVVLGSQRTGGEKLRACGHQVRFADLDGALADLMGKVNSVDIQPLAPGDGPRRNADNEIPAYLQSRPPRFVLRSRVVLDAPINDVFDFFSRPQNLGLLTPATMSFRIRSAPDVVQAGSTIDYTLRIAGAPLRWQTMIERWDPGHGFVDSQRHGPYRSWWHEHLFTAEGTHTVMEDRVYFALPLGVLGKVAQSLFVAGQLRDVFGFRSQAVAQRFRAVG
jgi:ligand-binding SRPBCC domain-containing protein